MFVVVVLWFQALEDRSNYLIVVLCKEVKIEHLDNTMRQYVRTKTYLRKDSPWFWKQLLHALPQNPMATLPGGERDGDWSGVEALARVQNDEFRRALRRDQNPEIKIDLLKNQVRYNKQCEQAAIEMGGRVWKPLRKVYVNYPTFVRGYIILQYWFDPLNYIHIRQAPPLSNVNMWFERWNDMIMPITRANNFYRKLVW